MNNKIKETRINKNLKIREVAEALKVDASLISKFESGSRKPTREQVIKIAHLLELDAHDLLIDWFSNQIVEDIGYGDFALEVLSVAEEKIKYHAKVDHQHKGSLEILLDEIDDLKVKLNEYRKLDSYRISQALELEYTFESNRIEGNTLTLRETDLVVNEGITISGKTMREHLEAINHKEAINYLKELIQKDSDFSERDLLQLHALILKGIDSKYAGNYRDVQVMINGSRHLPPQPYIIKKQMEELFFWYVAHKNQLHSVVLAAELSERLVTIHPFIDGNGRTSRLIMNLVLLKNGYVIANIKGDAENRMKYYQTLENAQVEGKKEDFHLFVANEELQSLKRYCNILGV
ncbi:MAG: Fic family protein [Bacteroidetes bacterium]|nr:Fic family protein [Bacteroidota bacterium]MBU1372037.1 Fic family protein [Bacteroidota bacterium]MBU1483639.1 Fic family protein [Bacteroidota bacterium]MBU1760856.1 Fic family protein [Bacteroidota bacterium]MBU2046846.1 Fic family protein [Bacteroidota bacterium]